jgi:LysR family hydrogen peroxide-inducible transcriptional activator
MDLRQLNALVAVADHGTFSAAADALLTVQSNVSSHVARLERELGVALVDRAGCVPTPEGQVVVNRARRINAELEAIASDVAALRHDVSGTVRLGLIGTTGRWLAPLLLAAVADRHPGVRLALFEGTSASLEPQLATGRLELAVVNLPLPSVDFFTQPLFDEDLVLVVAADDPRAQRDEIDVAELDGVALLLPMPGTAFRRELDAAARAAGVRLSAAAELDGVRLIASLTFEGNGPAILPATAVPAFLRDDWRSVAVRGLPRRRIGVAQPRRGLPSAPARAVLNLLREVVAAGAADQHGVHLVP